MKPTSKRREIKPRATERIAPTPIAVSDRTAPMLFGLEPRAFREFVTLRSIPHTKVGARVVVLAADLVEALGKDVPAIAPVVELRDEEPSVDELLARVGRRRA